MLNGNHPLGTVGIMGGVPFVHTEFAWSLAQLVQYTNEYVCGPGEFVHWTKASLSYHSAARNQLADTMLGDWLLMLDADLAFEPDLLARLLRTFNTENQLDVLTGLYHFKSPPHPPVLYTASASPDAFDLMGDWDRLDGKYLVPVASAGAGCLLVRRAVFERIRHELKESPFNILAPLGEDHSFFKRLERLGIKAYCDPVIECFHLRTQPISAADYDREAVLLGPRQEVS